MFVHKELWRRIRYERLMELASQVPKIGRRPSKPSRTVTGWLMVNIEGPERFIVLLGGMCWGDKKVMMIMHNTSS